MAPLNKTDKIYVAGHTGLVGSTIAATLQARGYQNLILRSRDELNLFDASSVKKFFETERPDVVFLAAAKVGGIEANNTLRADFIHDNLAVQNHVIWNAHHAGTRRLIFLGSSCIYPKMASQPMPETSLLTGPLEYTNRPYALAKIAGLELVESLRKQYNRDYLSVMPTNLYGPGDNFDPQRSHVLPSLIRKFWEGKKQNLPEVMVWGSGKPLREFMFSKDCADAIVFIAETLTSQQLDSSPIGQAGWSHVNIGSGQEVSISELAHLIASEVGYTGKIVYDSSKPDGTPRKLLDTTYLRSLGWKPKYTLAQGLKEAIQWFVESQKS